MIYGRTNWKQLLSVSAFVLFAVPAFAGFKVTASTASPSTVSKGQTVAFSAQVQSMSYAWNMIVDLELYNAAGVKVGQQFSGNQTFRAGQIAQYTWNYALPATAASGKYTFKVGVFSPTWSSLVLWNNSAATFSLSGTTATATNGLCGSANGQSLSTAPTTNLCSAGTASKLSGSGPWTWQCAGSNGGTTASCSASLAASKPPIPSAPAGLVPSAGNSQVSLTWSTTSDRKSVV